MALFHESIKQILAEVEKFLNETLKNEKKLSKQTNEHKQQILEKLNNFFSENPSMKILKTDTLTADVGTDESSMTGGSSNTEEGDDSAYNDQGMPDIAATDLTEAIISGYLDKKQKKGLFGAKFQKRWCVVKNGIMYYYVKPEDKKQAGSFKLEGYGFRHAPELASKSKEKELAFELAMEGDKRAHQFIASNRDDFERWKDVIQAGGHYEEEDLYEVVEPHAPGKSAPELIPSSPEPETPEPVEEQEYDDPQGPADQNPTPPRPAKAVPQVPLPPTPPPATGTRKQPTPSSTTEDQSEELYEDAMTAAESQAEESAPILPPPRRVLNMPLPEIPVSRKKIKLSITCNPVTDFENQYYGKWDCNGDTSQELSFHRGDIIYIVSKEFDEKSWWLGEIAGKFGLVPKNYLVPAYEVAA